MKTITPQLLAFLQTHESFNRADLIMIELLNGQVITATTWQVPIVFISPAASPPISQTYYPSKFGAWERGVVKSKVDFKPKPEDMALTVFADSTITFPVATTSPALNKSLMQVVTSGLLDAAKVSVYTIYWGLDETPQDGVNKGALTLFVGQIAQTEQTGRTKATFRCTDMLYLLNHSTPPNIIASGCRHTLFDPGCTLTKSQWKKSNSATTGSNSFFINLATDVTTHIITIGNQVFRYTQGNITYTQGEIIFTSGQNNGLKYFIKSQINSTRIQLGVPLKFPIAVGDTFDMYPGCSKTVSSCKNNFNNLINFGGMPFVPNPEVAV